MTAEQYFIETWGDSENGNLIKPMFLEHFMTPDNVIQLMQNYAKLKCEEQRQICADNAQMEIYTSRDDMSYLTKKNSNTVWEDYNDGKSYTEYQKVYEIGILNSPEPEI